MSTPFSHFLEKINHFSPLERDFTKQLEHIALTPKTLYSIGKIPENVVQDGVSYRPKAVAIVGSRHNTKYGEEIAYQLAYELGQRGVVVISGLAQGIDSIAHRGCLDAGGTTVAVLGTRIDEIFPRSHQPLAVRILESGGAIISEYPPASHVNPKYSFLCRNRLISGLSDAVVVIEAATRSGSLNTATHALAQGRDVFAVPGNITSPYSAGTNRLIAEGAIPYTAPSDVLDLLFPAAAIEEWRTARGRGLIGDNDVETKILGAMAQGYRSADSIMAAAQLPPEVFGQSITMLEVKGRIRAIAAGGWMLV